MALNVAQQPIGRSEANGYFGRQAAGRPSTIKCSINDSFSGLNRSRARCGPTCLTVNGHPGSHCQAPLSSLKSLRSARNWYARTKAGTFT